MMAGNPNWWGMFQPSFTSFAEQPQSWSQLLLGDEDRVLNQTQISNFQTKKLENWEDQILSNNNNNLSPVAAPNFGEFFKQEFPKRDHSLILQPPSTTLTTSHTNNFLSFSCNSNNQDHINNHTATAGCLDLSPESNHSSVTAGGPCKKARVHPPSSSQPPLKVRKEKLVDRITTLHQIVSPFGKTDTASVLSEAIGYIRFLHGQIEALSYPYLRTAPKDLTNPHPSLLNDSCLKRKATANQGEEMIRQEKALKDLRSKGLCLVPVSCTQLVEADNNGAAYWTPNSYGSGF